MTNQNYFTFSKCLEALHEHFIFSPVTTHSCSVESCILLIDSHWKRGKHGFLIGDKYCAFLEGAKKAFTKNLSESVILVKTVVQKKHDIFT